MKRLNKILFVIFLLIFLGAVGFGIWYYVSENQRESTYEELADKVTVTETVTPEPTSTPVQTPTAEAVAEPTPEPTAEPVQIPIDFAALQEENPDIYAWIRIPGTVVDYPIAQRPSDDAYYLNHTVEGAAGLPGSIYTESMNNKDFTDANTVIYGHNMINGSMFGNLSQYMDAGYMAEHETIYIYTPEHIYTYRVFGGITYDDRHIMYAFDFNDAEQYQAYLDSIYGVRNMSSYLNPEVTVTTEDRILTLSTCTGNSSERFLVEAVLVDET